MRSAATPEMRWYFPNGTLTGEETKKEPEWFLNGHPGPPRVGAVANVEGTISVVKSSSVFEKEL
jgi:hypothetical protein